MTATQSMTPNSSKLSLDSLRSLYNNTVLFYDQIDDRGVVGDGTKAESLSRGTIPRPVWSCKKCVLAFMPSSDFKEKYHVLTKLNHLATTKLNR